MIKTIDKKFVLVNVFNANTDNEEMPTLIELNKMLSNVSDTSTTHLIIGAALIFIFI